MEKHILMTEEELEEEVQKELEDGDFSEPDIEIINQKKASKLNRFKFSPNVYSTFEKLEKNSLQRGRSVLL